MGINIRRIKRVTLFWWQRRTRGFDDSELWNLDATIAKFALPRLKRLKDVRCGHPAELTDVEWAAILDDIIWMLERHAMCDCTVFLSDIARSDRAHAAWADYFGALWS